MQPRATLEHRYERSNLPALLTPPVSLRPVSVGCSLPFIRAYNHSAAVAARACYRDRCGLRRSPNDDAPCSIVM
jgi:hypothetical protein